MCSVDCVAAMGGFGYFSKTTVFIFPQNSQVDGRDDAHVVRRIRHLRQGDTIADELRAHLNVTQEEANG